MVPNAREPFDPAPLVAALAGGEVDFVVVGGVAGGAHGSSYGTFDLDVAYSRDRDNLDRLVSVLRELGARLRGAPADVPFQLDVRSLEYGANFTFDTKYGSLDILAFPTGAPPYERLRADAMVVDVRGHRVRIASLDHLIAMKESTGRTKDRLHATEYRVISDELRAPRPSTE